ncbi:MAG: hypothetical protein ACU0DW_05150 [Shimia sp.]
MKPNRNRRGFGALIGLFGMERPPLRHPPTRHAALLHDALRGRP